MTGFANIPVADHRVNSFQDRRQAGQLFCTDLWSLVLSKNSMGVACLMRLEISEFSGRSLWGQQISSKIDYTSCTIVNNVLYNFFLKRRIINVFVRCYCLCLSTSEQRDVDYWSQSPKISRN